jgi:hypothetical protein
MREGLMCDGVGGLFVALPPDACNIIISYLAELDLLRIQYVCKGWFALINKSAAVRGSLKDLDLSYDVIGASRTTSGRTLRERRGRRLLHLASGVVRSALRMGVVETVSLEFVVFKAWAGLPEFLQDGALHYALDYHGDEDLSCLYKASSYYLGDSRSQKHPEPA